MEQVRLDAIADDATFRLREPGDVSALATAIGRLGQLTPVDLRPLPAADGEGPRYQVVAGFRRIAAARLLQRDRVLARVHAPLADPDAWALALGPTLFAEPWDAPARTIAEERVRAFLPWAEPALRTSPTPRAGAGGPGVAAVDPRSLALRAWELNRDLAAACGRWDSLPAEARRAVVEQLRYVTRLLPILERDPR